MTKKYWIQVGGLLTTLLLMVVLTGLPSQNIPLYKPNAVGQLEQWQIGGTNSDIILPVYLAGARQESFYISQELGADFEKAQAILLRSSLQNVKLYLNDEMIYAVEFSETTPFVSPIASLWHIVHIPAGSQGQRLGVEITSPFVPMSGRFNPIYYGQSGDLKQYVFDTYFPGFALSVLIFISGLLLSFVAIVVHKRKFIDVIYLGFFAMVLSTWFVSESRMLQFFTGNTTILGSLSYWSLALLPLPLALYIRETIIVKTRWVYTSIAWMSFALFIIVIGLQVSGIMYYFETLFLVHPFIFMTVMACLASLAYEAKAYKNDEAYSFMKHIGLLFIFGILELLNFLRSDFDLVSLYLKIGFIVFLTAQTSRAIKRLISLVQKSHKAEIYQELAYHDRLTGGKNRLAFEIDLESTVSKAQIAHLLILDLNNLKRINDTFGHSGGDDAIRAAYEAAMIIFGPYGHCYRIGGDEFACIINDISATDVDIAIVCFHETLKDVSKPLPFEVTVSVGYATYHHNTEETIDQMIQRADLEMYKQKNLKEYV